MQSKSVGWPLVVGAVCFSFLILFAPSLHAQTQPAAPPAPTSQAAASPVPIDALCQKIRARLEELHKNAAFPGVTVGFVLSDGRSGSVSVGLADLEAKTPLKPRDRLLSGSIGKTYVSAVALQLVGEGKLQLDEKIEKWLGAESWFGRLPNAKDITLRMLMQHTSGVMEHVYDKDFVKTLREQPDKVWKPEELVAYILDKEPLFPAGRGWSYADTNYILVGMIIEKAAGRPFYTEAVERLLKPFKLERTIPSDRRMLSDVITGYSQMPNTPFGFEGRLIVDGKFVVNPQLEWTGGGFASTAEDLARWARLLYRGEVVRDAKLMEQLLDAVPARTGPGDKYGLGVQVRRSRWGATYGHGGWFPGYLSEMEYFPRQGVAIAVQFNTDGFQKLGKSPRAYVAEIARILLGEPEEKK